MGNPFDIIRGAFRNAASVAHQPAATEAVVHASESVGVTAGRTATSLGGAVAPSQLDLQAKLAMRTKVHEVRNQLLSRAEELRKLGSMLETVAQAEGPESIASHRPRYDRLQKEVAQLLIQHDSLVRESGQPMDSGAQSAVDAILSTRDPQRVVSLTMPDGSTALETRLNQLMGDGGEPIRRPILDVSDAPRPSVATRLASEASATPQRTVDRYNELVTGAPAAAPAVMQARDAASMSPRSLPDAAGARQSITLPEVARPQAAATNPAAPIGRSNRAVDFINRDLAEGLPGEEVTDQQMQARLKQLQEKPDMLGGFKGVSFEVGEDNAGPFKIRI